MLTKSKQNRLRTISVAIGLLTLPAFSTSAFAAGLGRITVQTALGEPLRAQLEVMAARDELASINARLASTEAFRLAGVEYATALSALKFSSRVKEDGGRQFIEITTDRPINEPFIDMLVELSWSSGRLVREYTFLLDPPELIAQREAAPPKASAVNEAPKAPTTADSATPKISVERSAPVAIEAASSRAKPTPAKTAIHAADSGAATDTLREVRRGDTLGIIAMQTRPGDVSLDQMLVALFRSNPDAFDGNMNRLRAGKILNIPSAEAVRSVDAGAARQEVIAQFSDFESYRNRLAGTAATAPAKTHAGGQTASGKIAPKVEDKLPVAAGADKLSVSKSESAKIAQGIATKGRLSALEEDLVARDRALKDAGGRIADLEKNLNDLKKLAEMKSQAGAAAQKSAEAAKAKPEPEKSVVAAPIPKEVPVVKAPEPDKAPEQIKAVVEPPPPKAEVAGVPSPAEKEPPKPAKPKKAVAPAPEPEPEAGFMEENTPVVFGGAGVLALLLGYFGFSAYRRKKSAAAALEAPLTQSSLAANSVFGEPTSVHTDSSGTLGDDVSVSETISEPTSDTVDPLVEADTYLAFGKDAQAEEILLDALRTDPARLAVHLKLLEIYAARRSTMQFNTLAEELRLQTGGEGPEWDRTVEMGLAVDPNNTLYQSAQLVADVAAPVEDHEATMVFSAPPVAEPAPMVDEVAALDFDLELDSGPSQSVESVAASASADVAALDFDLDLGSGDKADSPAVALEVEAMKQPLASKGLDIDFDLELPTSPPELAVLPVAAEVAGIVSEESGLVPDLELDLDLEIPETAPQAPPELDMPELSVDQAPLDLPPAEPASADSSGLDFDFDLGEPDVAEPTMPDALVAETAVMDMPSLEMPEPETNGDTGGLDFDLGEKRTEPVIRDDFPTDLVAPGGADLELPTDAATEVDNPEATTKLELALAYEEMGDRDGARELLEEVLTEGSSSQQAKAREKLDQLG